MEKPSIKVTKRNPFTFSLLEPISFLILDYGLVFLRELVFKNYKPFNRIFHKNFVDVFQAFQDPMLSSKDIAECNIPSCSTD